MKRILVSILFGFIVINAFATEGGGIITSNTGFIFPLPGTKEKPLTNISNYEKLTLWLSQSMDKQGNFNFGIQASYLFTVNAKIFKDTNKKEKPVISHIADLDYLNFEFLFPMGQSKSAKLNFGRYGITDHSKIVYNQNIDGLSFDYNNSGINFGFDIGYTGLLNTYTTPLYVKSKNKPNIVYSLAPAYITAGVDAVLPIGKYDHKFGVQILSFVQPKIKKPNHKTFFEVSLNGSIIPRLMFDITAVGAAGESFGNKNKSGMASLKLAYYFNKYNSVFGFKSIYASGGVNNFTGFSKVSLAKVKPVFPSNVALLGLYASIEPTESLVIAMDTNAFFYGKKPIKDTSVFYGFEWNVGINYTLLQDMYFAFDVGHYVRPSGSNDVSMKLKFMLSF